MIDALLNALQTIFSFPTFVFVILGVLIGIIFGSIPGIGGGLGMAIMLPFTLVLDSTTGIMFLIGIYLGAMYGGSIAAVLINAPGTAAAAATTLDGYPMSRNGRAREALTVSAVASSLSGMFSVIALFVLSPVITSVVLLFGSPEYFLLAFLGISMITVVSEGSIVKGLTAGVFGLLITTVGISPITPTLRYTGGLLLLYDGLSFLAGLIGMFAISEMFKLAREQGGISEVEIDTSGDKFAGIKECLKNPILLLKSSFIGMFVGSIPAAGATISNFISYSEAMRSSPETNYGDGVPEGVIASEASNSATVGGSLIPTFAFGIPGSPATAVFLGGLIMHGIIPGPTMFTEEQVLTFSIFFTLFIGSVLIMAFGIFMVSHMSIITKIDTNTIAPLVIVVAAFGALALRKNYVDVFTILIFGILGYYMTLYGYSIIALVLGMVLGGIAEENFLRSLSLSDGSYFIFTSSIISIVILLITIGIITSPLIASLKKRYV